MEYKWINTDDYIFGFNSKILDDNKLKMIYLFDLDDTIIKTKSGKKFASSSSDWIWLDPKIETKINKLFENNIIGIITNQKGLNNNTIKNIWITKIKNILSTLKIHFIFASIKDNRFRKPLIGSWEYILSNYLNDKYLTKKTYFIGDALGRESDHNDTDLKFAFNCKFIIKSPEKFFNLHNHKNTLGSITYPKLVFYTKSQQNLIINNIYSLIDSNIKLNNKIIIICIGLPASGKSFIRNLILHKFNKFKYFNNDDIINLKNNNLDLLLHKKLITNSNQLQSYNFIIDDNTNMNKKKLINFINLHFSNYYKISITFDYDFDICMHLNYMRMFWYNKPLISKVVYRTLLKNNDILIDHNFIKNNFNHSFIFNKLLYQFNNNTFNYYF